MKRFDIEQVHRRATWWILSLKPRQMPCWDRLLALNILPLVYDRDIMDHVFFYKTGYGYIDIDARDVKDWVGQR